MKKIVVIGGGTMGLDIAQVFAKKGYDVVVRDINDQIIQASEARLNKSLDKLVAKGKLDEAGKAAITGKMTFTTDLNLAADADLVVEAAVENLDIKKSIFGELDKISANRRPSWPPTHLPSPSRPSPRPPSGQTASSACTSSTLPPS